MVPSLAQLVLAPIIDLSLAWNISIPSMIFTLV
jgi:hypothetical protein